MKEGASLLVATLEGLVGGTIHPRPQPESAQLHHAPKIFKEDTHIAWDQPAHAIHNFIRGMSPHPAAFTLVDGKVLRIFAAHYEVVPGPVSPGTPESDNRTYLRFSAADGWVYADELQLEGKKRMDVAAFLRGFRI